MESLEKDAKKNNIVIKGLAIPSENTKNGVEQFLAEVFGVENKIVDARSLPGARQKPAIVVKLDSWNTKQEILNQKKKLNGKDIFIDRDLTYLERQSAKELRDLAKQYRAEGHIVKIGYRKLEIDGTWHFWSQKDRDLKKSDRPAVTKTSDLAAAGGSSAQVNTKN